MTVVVDSNVFISGLLFGGVPGRGLQKVVARELAVATSEPLQAEVERVLREKFRWQPERVREATQVFGTSPKSLRPSKSSGSLTIRATMRCWNALSRLAPRPSSRAIMTCSDSIRFEGS